MVPQGFEILLSLLLFKIIICLADGKLIFELSHRKEGERTSWVPVPKKTFWPPPGGAGGALVPAVAIAGSSRQESSTSLSGKIITKSVNELFFIKLHKK